MIRFFITRPAMVTLLLVLVVITGALTVGTMTVELWPPVDVNQVSVDTWYPGASPDEIEKLITIPLEDELDGLDDVDYVQSTSREGASSISVVFKPEVSGAAMDDRTRDVQQRVNRVTDLPGDASMPQVEKIATENIPVAILAVSGPMDELNVKYLAEDLVDELDDLPGMKKVWTTGVRDRQVAVIVDPQRLEAYQMSAEQVRGAIALRHNNVPAGSLYLGNQEILIRVLGKPEAIAGLGDIVLRDSSAGLVYLRDVAVIEDSFKDPVILSHLNGERCVMIMMAKEKFARTTTLVDDALRVSNDFNQRHPKLAINLVFDTAIYVRLRMRELLQNGVQGFFLVLIILWFTLGGRRALIVAIGIPTSFLGTFVVMKALGISLNFMTLYGMFIVLGILVDDAIVVVENITRYAEQGEPPRRAALLGAQQVCFPVIIAVTTTMVAFATMLLMKGMMGRFMGYLPKVVIIVLAFSLIESLLLAPSHIAEWVPPERADQPRRSRADRWLEGLREGLGRGLGWLLRHPLFAFTVPPLLLLGCLILGGMFLQVEMFPPEEPDQIYVSFELPPGQSLYATEEMAYQVQERIVGLQLTEVDSSYSAIGYSMEQEFGAGSRKNLGQVICVLKDRSERERSGFVIAELLREDLTDRYAGLESLRVTVPQSGPPTGKAINVRITGDDFAILEMIAAEITAFVAEYDGVINLEDSRVPGSPELRIRLDEDRAARAGVEFGTLAFTVRAMFVGIKSAERRMDEDNVDITVRAPDAVRQAHDALERVTVPSATGLPVPLVELVEVESARGPVAIHRRDGKHLITVTGEIREGPDGPLANGTEINQAIRAKFAESIPERFPGYEMQFGGEAEEQAESFGSLGIAFIAAMLLIYGLLVLQFNTLTQPLVVMFTVPMTLVGVILGMLIFGETFTLSHMIGIVALVGIAVNDAVVYVDYINHLRRDENMTGDAALIEAAKTRLRPILLTSLTTIAGLFPMAARLGGGSAYLSPLASSIIYGLATQTFFTLLFIPIALKIVEGFSETMNRRVMSRILPPHEPEDVI